MDEARSPLPRRADAVVGNRRLHPLLTKCRSNGELRRHVVKRLTTGFIAACGLALVLPYVAQAAVLSVGQGQVPLDRFGNPIKAGSTITEVEFFFNTRGEAK